MWVTIHERRGNEKTGQEKKKGKDIIPTLLYTDSEEKRRKIQTPKKRKSNPKRANRSCLYINMTTSIQLASSCMQAYIPYCLNESILIIFQKSILLSVHVLSCSSKVNQTTFHALWGQRSSMKMYNMTVYVFTQCLKMQSEKNIHTWACFPFTDYAISSVVSITV